MNFIDTHCHLLPGIDDGAVTLDQSLAMARAAVDDGIRYAVMTPHIHPGRYDNTRTSIERATRDFRRALRQKRIPLQIGMAAEVRLSPDILQMLGEDDIPFYGELDGFKLMLLEFPHSHIPPGSDKLVDRLIKQGVRPTIAHPERNKDVIRDIHKIEPFIDMGCFLQLTASAVAGRFGDDAHTCALEILKMDVFKILASDAHNLKARRPELSGGRDAAEAILGKSAADDLVTTNPRMISRSQFE